MTEEEERLLRESIMGLSAPDVMRTMTDQNLMGTVEPQPSFTPPVSMSGFNPEFYGNVYEPAVSPDIEQPTETTRFINDPVQGSVPDINLPVAESMNVNNQPVNLDAIGSTNVNTGGLSNKNITDAFFRGLGQSAKDLITSPFDTISDAVGVFSDAAANYGVNAPEGSFPKQVFNFLDDATRGIDPNKLKVTDDKIADIGLGAAEYITGKDLGTGGYFDAQGNFTPKVQDILDQREARLSGQQGPQIQTGEPDSAARNNNVVSRQEYIDSIRSGTGPVPAIAIKDKDGNLLEGQALRNAIADQMEDNMKFNRTPATGTMGATMQSPTPASINPFPDDPGVQRTRDELMRRFGAPTISQIQAQDARRAGRMTQQQTDQAFADDSADLQKRIRERARRPGETQTERDTRLAKARTQGTDRGEGLSQSEARDLAQGLSKGATEGEKARALQIQQRKGLGAFAPNRASTRQTPQEKVAAATQEVDLLIQQGIIKPENRGAAIRDKMNIDAEIGTGPTANMTIKSPEFSRISELLAPGGALEQQGIRVDLEKIDPVTGMPEIYREKPGFIEGLKPGPRERLPVSQDLINLLGPYARLLQQRQGRSAEEFSNIGLTINQFAGTTAQQ